MRKGTNAQVLSLSQREPGFEFEPAEGGIMKPSFLIGIFLVILGVIALTYQGITYTTRHKVLDIGPIQATREEHKTIPLPPVLGGIALISGVVLLLGGIKHE
jgi:hypothetical protein